MSVEHVIQLSRWIDGSQLGQFIGVKGRNIKAIEQKRKVVLNIEKDTLKITGPPKAVDLAIIDVEIQALGILSSSLQHSFEIPSERVGFLIGRNGQKINAIKIDSGAKINLEREETAREFAEVTVSGPFSVIVSAVGMIICRLDAFGKDSTPYNRADRREFYESWDEVIYEE